MKCTYCGTEFEGKFCPNCGAPVGDSNVDAEQQPIQQAAFTPVPVKAKKPFYKKWWFWVIVAVVVIGVIGSSVGNNNDKKTTSSNDTSITQSVDENSDVTTNNSSLETASTEDKQENTAPNDSNLETASTENKQENTTPTETQQSTESKATTSKAEAPAETSKNYESIYNEYAQKIKDAAPTSSINELAEITNEGVSEMAEYMLKAKGTDGQYATYEEWAGKLMDVYMNEAR